MADIFISYSSKDRAQAEQLTELLSSAGLSVWIDRQGIDVATSWSREIVEGINACKAMVLLLSSSSVASPNVVKEVSLASEKLKKIVPLDLEPVAIPPELEYQLAGIQRTPMTNIDSIIRALGKIGLEATQAPSIKLIKETDSRKSLMVLPFEDLSPTGDNEWFASGLAAELITSLSNIKALRVTDQQTTKAFKNYKGALPVYAKEMSIRYFIEGSVRKFGDQIKISSSLLDIETGDHLWQDSLKGTMDDIFDIQETVAKKVVEGLQVILTKDEEKKLDTKPTESTEAYELLLKALQHFQGHTKVDFERSLSLYQSAADLDPSFAMAYAGIAKICQVLYQSYERNPAFLDRIEAAARKILELEGETAQYYTTMSRLHQHRGDMEAALAAAERSVEVDPNYALGYDMLAQANLILHRGDEVLKAREAYVRIRPDAKEGHFNLIVSLQQFGSAERLLEAAKRGIAVFERLVRLNPDDYSIRVQLAIIYDLGGFKEKALDAADKLVNVESIDGYALFNLACLYFKCELDDRGLEVLARAVKRGYNNIEQFHDNHFFTNIEERPEFKAILQELQEKVEKQKQG